jgi:hypothetical protein
VAVRALLAVVALAAAFAIGRATAPSPGPPPPRPGTYDAGYLAGREDAFSGFDGGWVLGDPYIVILRRGRPGLTYRFARRWPLEPGREYRTCARDFICSRPAG